MHVCVHACVRVCRWVSLTLWVGGGCGCVSTLVVLGSVSMEGVVRVCLSVCGCVCLEGWLCVCVCTCDICDLSGG